MEKLGYNILLCELDSLIDKFNLNILTEDEGKRYTQINKKLIGHSTNIFSKTYLSMLKNIIHKLRRPFLLMKELRKDRKNG